MPSFSRLSRWPVSYFRAYSRWLLRHAKTVSPRAATLTAEINRIGIITVGYRAEETEGGGYKMTEERMAFSVTERTTLARLLQAYIAQGGNPFDIGPLWMPGLTQNVGLDGNGNPVRVETYPHGGILSALSANPSDPMPQVQTDDEGNEVVIRSGMGHNLAGTANTEEGNIVARLGTRAHPSDHHTTMAMRKMRDWANQDIKEMLTDLEWRIVKQMDLREQLTKERDEILAQAFGGTVDGSPSLGTRRVNPKLTVPALVQEFYEILYEVDDEGAVVAFRAGPDIEGLEFAYEDVASEVLRDPLG